MSRAQMSPTLSFSPGKVFFTQGSAYHQFLLKSISSFLLGLLPTPLPHLFLHRPRPQLERMYPPFTLHLLLQQRIHHAVPRRLHFRRKGFRHNHHAEMRLLRYTPLHGAVVRVLVGVVVDLKSRGVQRCCDLGVDWLISVDENEGGGEGLPFVVWCLRLGWWSWWLGVVRVEMGCNVASPLASL